MKKYNNLLESCLNISGLTGSIQDYCDLQTRFILNSGASEKLIIDCDQSLGGNLPNDYKLFLARYNGGLMFEYKSYSGYEFYGAEELITQNEFQKTNFEDNWDSSIIFFCRCLGDNEYLGFRLIDSINYQILFCIGDQLPSTWEIISESFDDLLFSLLQEKGKKFWLPKAE